MSSEFLGKSISLISKSDIRYQGILQRINESDSTLELRQVKIFGTEGRRGGRDEIPPSHQVYDNIVFKGADIKDLQVNETAPIMPGPAIPQQMPMGMPMMPGAMPGGMPTGMPGGMPGAMPAGMPGMTMGYHPGLSAAGLNPYFLQQLAASNPALLHQLTQQMSQWNISADNLGFDEKEVVKTPPAPAPVAIEKPKAAPVEKPVEKKEHAKPVSEASKPVEKKEAPKPVEKKEPPKPIEKKEAHKSEKKESTRSTDSKPAPRQKSPSRASDLTPPSFVSIVAGTAHRDESTQTTSTTEKPERSVFDNRRGAPRSRGRGGLPRGTAVPDQEYDIDAANKKFEEMAKSEIPDLHHPHHAAENDDDSGEEVEEGNFYDKSSFFDNISCDSKDRQQIGGQRMSHQQERQQNFETFGVAMSHGGYRRGRGRGRGGQRGRGRGGSSQSRGTF